MLREVEQHAQSAQVSILQGSEDASVCVCVCVCVSVSVCVLCHFACQVII